MPARVGIRAVSCCWRRAAAHCLERIYVSSRIGGGVRRAQGQQAMYPPPDGKASCKCRVVVVDLADAKWGFRRFGRRAAAADVWGVVGTRTNERPPRRLRTNQAPAAAVDRSIDPSQMQYAQIPNSDRTPISAQKLAFCGPTRLVVGRRKAAARGGRHTTGGVLRRGPDASGRVDRDIQRRCADSSMFRRPRVCPSQNRAWVQGLVVVFWASKSRGATAAAIWVVEGGVRPGYHGLRQQDTGLLRAFGAV